MTFRNALDAAGMREANKVGVAQGGKWLKEKRLQRKKRRSCGN